MTQEFWHIVDGKRYTSAALETPPKSLEEYREVLRFAYGSLKGVKVGAVSQGKPHPKF